MMSFRHSDATHTTSRTTHRTYRFLVEANGLARRGEQHDFRIPLGDGRTNQGVTLVKRQSDQTVAARTGEIRQRRFLDHTRRGGHQHVLVFRIVTNRQEGGNTLPFFQRQDVDHRTTAGRAAGPGNLEHPQPVHLAPVGEAQNGVVGVRDQQFLDEIFVFHGRSGLATTTTALGLIVFDGLSLGITTVGDGDHQIFLVDQIGDGQVTLGAGDFGQTGIAKLGHHRFQFFTDNLHQAVRIAQNFQQVRNFLENVLVLILELFGLKTGQAVQSQVKDRLSLFWRQVIKTITQAKDLRQIIGATCVFARPLKHRQNVTRCPALSHQLLFRLGRSRRRLDQRDDFIDVRQSNREAFQDMATFAGFTQFVNGTAGNHFAAMPDKCVQHFLEIEDFRLAVDQGDHVDAENRLQLSVGKEVINDHVRVFTATQLNHYPDTFLVGLVPQLGDAFQSLLFYQLCNFLDQPRFVQLVRQLGNNDGVAVGFLVVLDFMAGTDVDAPTAGAVGLNNAGATINDALGGKVRPRNMLHQVVDGHIRIINQCQAAVHNFRQVMGRNIGGHTHGNA